jgi:SAM-dependent methyltransferase
MAWLLATLYDRFMLGSERASFTEWRAELLRSIDGDVLEIGAGTGANLPYYGAEVKRLVLGEPDGHMRRKLAARVRREGPVNAEVRALDAAYLRLPPATFDAVVSTFVLCSVRDQRETLLQIRRVLRPGGRLFFLEHVAAEAGSARLAWQRRIEPAWTRLSGHCHLTRHTDDAIRDAGFEIESEKRESVRKALRFLRPSIRGVARLPPDGA